MTLAHDRKNGSSCWRWLLATHGFVEALACAHKVQDVVDDAGSRDCRTSTWSGNYEWLFEIARGREGELVVRTVERAEWLRELHGDETDSDRRRRHLRAIA